jgi:hypothetical protein
LPSRPRAAHVRARITTAAALRQLLTEGGIAEADITAEDGRQEFRSPDDWWTVVLGSGYRWTVDRMDAQTVPSAFAPPISHRCGRIA